MIDQPPGVAEPPVRVTFVPTIDDRLQAMPPVVRPRGAKVWWLGIMLSILAVNVAARVVREGWSGFMQGPGVGLLVAAGALIGLLRAPSVVRAVLVRHLRANPQLDQPLTYEFSARGVRVESPVSTTEVPWASFVRARETREYFLFHVASSTAYVVPRRAMREREERRLRELLADRLGLRAEFTNDQSGR
jgi:hypothetical protein